MSGNGELRLNSVNISGSKPLIPKKDDNISTNFYRQQDIFNQAKEKTMATPEVENVYMNVSDEGASKRDLQAYDIAARPYNISGFKVMKDSDMFKKFLEINGDDFTEGLNDRGENVMLFNSESSDSKIQMFSVEKSKNGIEYYSIRDADGNVYNFTQDGKFAY